MKNKLKIFLISSISMASFSNLNAQSLRDSVEKTLNINPAIIAEYLDREAYKKYVDQEEGDYLPTLDFEAFTEKSKTYNDPDRTPPAEGWTEKDGWNAILKLEHTLYDGGLTPSEAAEFRYKFYGNNYRSTQEVESIVLDTVNAYNDLVRTQELMALSKNNIKIHEDYLIIAKEKEEISGEILETYQVNSKYHFILDRYLEQENEKNQALSLYRKLVGEELNDNICRPQIDDRFIPKTLEEAIELGLRRSYKVKEQIEKIKEQREKIVQSESAFSPTILFQLQAQADNDLELEENGSQDIYRARIFMSWNLFNGGKDYHATEKEKLFLMEEQKKLDVITEEVTDEIKSAYRTFQNYKKRIENIEKYVDDNYNIVKVYKKQLADGTRTFIDILNAESELYRADIDKIDQDFEFINSYYQVLFNMSVLSDTILMQKNQTCGKYLFTPRVEETKQNKEDDKLSDELLNMFGENPPAKDEKKTDEVKSTEQKAEEAPVLDINIDDRLESIYEGSEEKSKETVENNKPVNKTDLKKYTVNMGNFKTEEEVKSFIKRYSLTDTEYYKWGKNGENIKLLYGSYDSVKNAKEAMSYLDKKVLSSGVYVDGMKKHEKLKIKYKNFN